MNDTLGPWQKIELGNPQPEALVTFYVPPGNYIWGTGKDASTIREKYPNATHYKVITEAPGV